VWVAGFRLRASYIGSIFAAYEQRVTGNFTGTTDQIIRWGACKWGFDEQDIRAQAVVESTWRQSQLGDCGVTTQPETKGCASVGLLQVKGADIPATHPGTWPAGLTSTAFNVDYALAVRRLCYEGKETWMRDFNASYAAGDLWGCIGRWYSGRWHDADAERYITLVRSTLNARPWLSPTF
jgi:autotransporter family porin